MKGQRKISKDRLKKFLIMFFAKVWQRRLSQERAAKHLRTVTNIIGQSSKFEEVRLLIDAAFAKKGSALLIVEDFFDIVTFVEFRTSLERAEGVHYASPHRSGAKPKRLRNSAAIIIMGLALSQPVNNHNLRGADNYVQPRSRFYGIIFSPR